MSVRFASEQPLEELVPFAVDSGFVWNILVISSGYLLDIQMERSIRKLDRSLVDEGKGHTGEESF